MRSSLRNEQLAKVCGRLVLLTYNLRLFSLGTLEEHVVRNKSAHNTGLKDNISHAVAAIDVTILRRVYLYMISRAQLCSDAAGGQFQHHL
jgi:hypothetical protein